MSGIKKPLLQSMAEETNAIPDTEEGLKNVVRLINEKDPQYCEEIKKQENTANKEETQEDFVFNPNDIEPLVVDPESIRKGVEEFRKELFVDIEEHKNDKEEQEEQKEGQEEEKNEIVSSIIQLGTDEEKEI